MEFKMVPSERSNKSFAFLEIWFFVVAALFSVAGLFNSFSNYFWLRVAVTFYIMANTIKHLREKIEK